MDVVLDFGGDGFKIRREGVPGVASDRRDTMRSGEVWVVLLPPKNELRDQSKRPVRQPRRWR